MSLAAAAACFLSFPNKVESRCGSLPHTVVPLLGLLGAATLSETIRSGVCT
jgi:hypothetical protein